MDKVTAAMVLTSLSTSPLVRSPPVRPNGEHDHFGELALKSQRFGMIYAAEHPCLKKDPFWCQDQP